MTETMMALRCRRRMFALALLVAAVFIAIGGPRAWATPWSGNLLTNPGAENGDLTGWTTDDATTVRAIQSLTQSTGTVYPHSGDWFFDFTGRSLGVGAATLALWQDADIAAYATDIDAGRLYVSGAVYLQTEDASYLTGADYARLSIEYLDGTGGSLGGLTTGWVQSPNLTWAQYELSGLVPTTAREIRFDLEGLKGETTYVNAFFDDGDLQVRVIPEPISLVFFATGLVGVLGFVARKRMRRS